MRAARRVLAVLLLSLLGLGLAALPAAAAAFAVTFDAPDFPGAIPAGRTVTVPVTLTNTGDAVLPARGGPGGFGVRLSYHWYSASGAVHTWDGLRTPLPADLAPGASVTVEAQVQAPAQVGSYVLRFAMVQDGVQDGWGDAEPTARAVSVTPALAVAFGELSVPTLPANATSTVAVRVTNTGGDAWNAGGANPVRLAYHWYDSAGRLVVYDGLRTQLGANVMPGDSRTLDAQIRTPSATGTYTLELEMVKEGVRWFGPALRLAVRVEVPIFGAAYQLNAAGQHFIGESKTLPVTLANTGNIPWNAGGEGPVHLAYHWYDAQGRLVSWDGVRTALGADVAPGESRTLAMNVLMPTAPGSYSLRVDLVREGIAWFSGLDVPPLAVSTSVGTGFGAAYGAVALPRPIAQDLRYPVRMTVTNNGPRVWHAGGSFPVRLSYHILSGTGALVRWDGERGALPRDVRPGESVTVEVLLVVPSTPGAYRVMWDMVMEGVTWFSDHAVASSRVDIDVISGVTFFGKGWGHGIGMSQWGAQGWATGVTGVTKTGEQIVAHYFPGTALAPIPAGTPPFRVLLSSPSTGCIARTITSAATVRSDGGMMVARVAAQQQPLFTATAGQAVQVSMSGTSIVVTANGQVVHSGTDSVLVRPADATKPIAVDQKNRAYHGDLVFESAGQNALRVVNYVGHDDYTRGAVPSEMPTLFNWHLEAFKAQAYAARTYAAYQQRGATGRAWDVRDDTSDQCYGGAASATSQRVLTDQAVAATAGLIITHNGLPIAAYYSSSSGGATEGNGCIWQAVKQPNVEDGRWHCGTGLPYLQHVDDPADLLAFDSRGPNPHTTWSVTFTGDQIRQAILRYTANTPGNFEIGQFVRIDLSNTAPSGRVIGVRITGTLRTVELNGESFLRSTLGLKSTLVKTSPW